MQNHAAHQAGRLAHPADYRLPDRDRTPGETSHPAPLALPRSLTVWPLVLLGWNSLTIRNVGPNLGKSRRMGVTIYGGNAGDRNDRAMKRAISLGTQIAKHFAVSAEIVASPVAPIEGDWLVQFKAAEQDLRVLSANPANQLSENKRPLLVMSSAGTGSKEEELDSLARGPASGGWSQANRGCKGENGACSPCRFLRDHK